ncbi:MAG: hypothetical protein IJ462_03090 [Clostridia bacterium]|nr:hypothetical protein [Clostridia bacterium]
MKIKYLGTAAAEGIPALFCQCETCEKARKTGIIRSRAQAIIDDCILLDFGPDTSTIWQKTASILEVSEEFSLPTPTRIT